ncbi:MAG: QacE family quaternary ammonium compound efflux SMR transporter [Anaerolineae bacterium]|nr:MAG: QacE family quaternary ammonium compound efflux SMR transporter [Anaerolineae bacterium]
MSWLYLFLAIFSEVAGTISMKLSQGFSKLLPSVLMFILYGVSLAFTNLALKYLDVSLVYAIWSGLGTALVTIIGIVWFREPVTALKLISIGLIILGVTGLNLTAHGG